MDPSSGAVKAMANFPTYDPTKFNEVEDFSRFLNPVATEAYETGSGMKVFTMSTGLNENVVSKDSTYYDGGEVQVDDRLIENADGGYGTIPMSTVIQNSVNTGVVHVLGQLGGGSINEQSRNTLHRYFTEKYGFGRATGIAQANEAAGTVIGPTDEEGNNVRYANMTFGQGITVTMLQMASALSSIVNGGNYYQPHIVAGSIDDTGELQENKPQVIRDKIISPSVSRDISEMMELVVQNGGGQTARRDGYKVGGKTGTSQVIDEATGLYSEFRENGSFIGFGASNKADYVIMTRINEPTIDGYAGSVAAAPLFADISNFLIDYYQIPPNN
jgi:cell division protein FtsI/penicillin-binding protein 2